MDGNINNKPRYEEIKEYLLKQIENSAYEPENKIEGEYKLAEKFNVSRMTVRQAINELIQENILYSIKRKGTFINKRSRFKEFDGLNSFTEDANRKNKITETKVISYKKVLANEILAKAIGSKINIEFWQIKRVRLIDGEPVAYEEGYYNSELIGEVNDEIVEGSLYKYFEERLKLDISYADQEIDACLAGEELGLYLDIDKSEPLLRVLQTTFVNSGQCLEYGYTYYRVDKYTFTQVAYRKR